MSALLRRGFSLPGVVLCVAAACAFASPVSALDPKSPEIMAMVKKGCEFMVQDPVANTYYGGDCLVAYALLKADYPQDHPKVQAAVAKVREVVKGPEDEFDKHAGGSVYSPAVAIILLCELDDQQNAGMVQTLVNWMLKRQHASGCWGYKNSPNVGDTSQEQYAVLSLWTADYHGFQVPPDALERALAWLMRVQGVEGNYTYNPADPGTMVRIAQSGGQPSLQAASCGTLYILGDFLRLTPRSQKEEEDILPPALKMVKEETSRPGAPPALKVVTEDVYEERVAAADAAFARIYTAGPTTNTYYYYYALERYMSFRAVQTGVKDERWYDEVAAQLKTAQAANGSWTGVASFGQSVETAFAVLFLTRSTAKSIQRKIQREGLLLGGMGLPADTTNVRISGGRVVGMELSKNLDDLINLLESDNAQEDVSLLAQQIEELEIIPGARLDEAQTARLNRLAGHPAYEVRILAVKAMMRSRDVRVAPALIYALSDPDDRVKQAATDGLRFISRKFDGVPLPATPSALEVEKAQEQWRAWYRTVAPPGSSAK